MQKINPETGLAELPSPDLFFRVSFDIDGDVRLTVRRRKRFLWVFSYSQYERSSYGSFRDEDDLRAVMLSISHLLARVQRDIIERDRLVDTFSGNYPPKKLPKEQV